MKFYQHLKAPNDTNGNPRRLYAVYASGEISASDGAPWVRRIAIHDEGYSGLPKALRGIPDIFPASITPAEYRELKKLAIYTEE